MFYMIRGCGQMVGLVIGGAMFLYQLHEVLELKAEYVASEATVEGRLTILRALWNNREEGAESIEGIMRAWALVIVWAVTAALAGITAIASFWMKQYRLDRKWKVEEAKPMLNEMMKRTIEAQRWTKSPKA
jgi:hypothetical protein